MSNWTNYDYDREVSVISPDEMAIKLTAHGVHPDSNLAKGVLLAYLAFDDPAGNWFAIDPAQAQTAPAQSRGAGAATRAPTLQSSDPREQNMALVCAAMGLTASAKGGAADASPPKLPIVSHARDNSDLVAAAMGLQARPQPVE